MPHDLQDQFAAFFSKLNPSSRFTAIAAREYQTIKKLLEDTCVLTPTCFLQGSYREHTAIHAINDIDIVALCSLWQPGAGGSGTTWSRDEIFAAVAEPLARSSRYGKKVSFRSQSMCIKIDLGIKVEILPAVYKAGTNDPAREPFRLYRPGLGWEDGYAREHRAHLSKKNEACNGNFIPAVKVLKHLRSLFELTTVSFHLECLLYAVPDAAFLGTPAQYLPLVLRELGAIACSTIARNAVTTPCGERRLFTSTEFDEAKRTEFCLALGFWQSRADAASRASSRREATAYWKMLLGDEFFPAPSPTM